LKEDVEEEGKWGRRRLVYSDQKEPVEWFRFYIERL